MIQVFVATCDGYAERIARALSESLSRKSLESELVLLDTSSASAKINLEAEVIVLVAAVRYGKHLPVTDDFLSQYARLTNAPSLALASVNLVARKPGRQSAETNPYLRKLISQYDLTPAVATAFAGRLCYPQYNWRDRQIIRLIMFLTGGNADGHSIIEYTNWEQVGDFASSVAALARGEANPYETDAID